MLGAHHSNIGGGEVITCAQYGVPGSLGERVCEAVTEIQSGWMTPFAISPPAAHRPGGQVCVNGHDVDLRVTEESVDDVLPAGQSLASMTMPSSTRMAAGISRARAFSRWTAS